MKKTLSFTLDGYDKPFEVRELTPRQILKFMGADSISPSSEKEDEASKPGKGVSLPTFIDFATHDFLPQVCNITLEELMDMAPSDIEICWNKFREVNKSFFGIAKAAGLTSVLDGLKKSIITDFSRLLVI